MISSFLFCKEVHFANCYDYQILPIFLRKTTYYIDNKKIIDNKNIF